MSPTLLEFTVLLGLCVLLAAYCWALYKAVRARNSPVDQAGSDNPDVPKKAESLSADEGELENAKRN